MQVVSRKYAFPNAIHSVHLETNKNLAKCMGVCKHILNTKDYPWEERCYLEVLSGPPYNKMDTRCDMNCLRDQPNLTGVNHIPFSRSRQIWEARGISVLRNTNYCSSRQKVYISQHIMPPAINVTSLERLILLVMSWAVTKTSFKSEYIYLSIIVRSDTVGSG